MKKYLRVIFFRKKTFKKFKDCNNLNNIIAKSH